MKNLFSLLERKATWEAVSPPIARVGNQDPIYVEQIKAMRAKFEYRIDMLKIRVVAVTSAIAGEGKKTSCAQLAIHLAMTGRKKGLLVAADMRKSDLAKGMNLPTLPGLGEFLTGTVTLKEIVRNSFLPGLYIISGGSRIGEPANLLAGEKFRAFLGDVRSQFDVILLDTPPILPVADTLGLRDQVDGFLFLYRVGHTPYPMLRQAAEEVGEEKILGVVLNGVMPKNQRYYQRYYGKYYQKVNQEDPTA